MASKKKVSGVQEDPIEYEYGDLYILCSKGHKTKMGENIETGLQLLIFNKENSYVSLSCPECDKDYNLVLRLLPAENPPAKEVGDEPEIKETKDELQEDTDKG
jgi:hypothetical protein